MTIRKDGAAIELSLSELVEVMASLVGSDKLIVKNGPKTYRGPTNIQLRTGRRGNIELIVADDLNECLKALESIEIAETLELDPILCAE
jgi:hypothetical protein